MATEGRIETTDAEGVEFALSRSIYRRLGPPLGDSAVARQRVLDACEVTMRRLVTEPHFAKPARFLFEEIRCYYSLDDQLWVRRTIETHVVIARQIVERLPTPKRDCSAFTRAGSPCQREPLPGSEFCPSHRHLELLDEPAV